MANQSPIHSQHHIIPPIAYFKTWVALMVLLALTVIFARIDLGIMNNVIAMLISITKSVLVILIFMGVYYSSKLTKVWAMVGFVWVMFLAGILVDYAVTPPNQGFAGSGSMLPTHAQYIGTPVPQESVNQDYMTPSENPKIQQRMNQMQSPSGSN